MDRLRRGWVCLSGVPCRVFAGVACFALCAVMLTFAPGVRAEEAGERARGLTNEQVQALIPIVLKLHLLRPELDAARLRRMLTRFQDQLDPSHTMYLREEAEKRTQLTDDQVRDLSKDLRSGKLDYFRSWAEDFKTQILPRDVCFSMGLPGRKEQLTTRIKRDEWEKVKFTEFPATEDDRVRRMVMLANREYHLYREYLSEEEAMKFTQQNFDRLREKWVKFDPERDVPDLVMKALVSSLDPHSEYMDAEDVEQFESSMVRGFSGIGVQIRGCPLGAQVIEVIEGGPASKSGRFDPADQIIQVDDTPIAGLPLSQIVKRIKGPKGSEVRLVVRKAKARADGKQLDTVTLVRDTIDLTELRVKGKRLQTEQGAVGVVSVQNYYQGVSGDVAERIRALSKDGPLAALVLDLRSNPGGLLEEAVKMAGLFIGEGPIVAERDFQGNSRWLYDPDDSQVFSGPLVILVNQYSASATEIVSGSLRDYGRAIIVGTSQTHGKGTVQRVIDLERANVPGKLKITFQQYFLARGDSVQNRGVEPDILLPGPKMIEELLERKQEGAIPFDRIEGRLADDHPDRAKHLAWRNAHLAALVENSGKRVAANKEFDIFRKADKEDDNEDPAAGAEAKKAENADPKTGKKDLPDPHLDETVRIAQDAAAAWTP